MSRTLLELQRHCMNSNRWKEITQHYLSSKQARGRKASCPEELPYSGPRNTKEPLINILSMLSVSVLTYPNFDLPLVLHTNASEEDLGAVVYQYQEGKFRVYWVSDFRKLKFLALKWAVCEKFQDYLYGILCKVFVLECADLFSCLSVYWIYANLGF